MFLIDLRKRNMCLKEGLTYVWQWNPPLHRSVTRDPCWSLWDCALSTSHSAQDEKRSLTEVKWLAQGLSPRTKLSWLGQIPRQPFLLAISLPEKGPSVFSVISFPSQFSWQTGLMQNCSLSYDTHCFAFQISFIRGSTNQQVLDVNTWSRPETLSQR